MAILASDIQFLQSGNANLGGAISAAVVSGLLNQFFDYVSSSEAIVGETDYRCLYIKNNHPTQTLYAARVWISSNTPSPSTGCLIGLGTAALSATEQTIPSELTAPTGVTFSSAASEGVALVIGDMPAGAYKAIWIRRDVSANAPAYNSDGLVLTVKGDSGA